MEGQRWDLRNWHMLLIKAVGADFFHEHIELAHIGSTGASAGAFAVRGQYACEVRDEDESVVEAHGC